MELPPRYRPLRPLPARAYVPGRSERPPVDDAAPAAGALELDAERWLENDAYLWGVDLYNAGFFWEAHEAWEALWRAAQSDQTQRAFLQSLIQLAAACLKGVLADRAAARRIAARALDRLDRVRDDRRTVYMGLDVVRFGAAFRAFVARDPTDVGARPPLVLVTLG